ncbi:glycosyltransferase family 4 protein [Paenibacillus sanguinis]|uniref:glycosyltransferase family 4 protein n=1 Tax=Paenibacillus sanguinis TaxID=225906 RepID=UPI000378C820|nr:glycosyltransferase family 4 protein [Paenibacillus sanguinis]
MKRKAAYIATVYSHLAAFHLPFMADLRRDGVEVHAYAAPDHCREEVKAAEFDCRDLPFSRHPLAPGNWQALGVLIRSLRQEQYEFVHVHTPNAAVIVRLAVWLAGLFRPGEVKRTRLVYTAHGFHFYRGAPWRNWLFYPLERGLARLTDVLITINQEDEQRARSFPVRGHVAYISGVGVEMERYASPQADEICRYRAELDLAPEDFVILCTAELNGNKNQGQLLAAVRELRRRGIPAVLLLAGTGRCEASYRKLAAEYGLTREVRLLGFRRDIPRLLHAADVVALLSQREGLPKALLEGMAAGKPLVATDVRGSRDLVAPGRNGYLVPVGDVSATAAALTRLHHDASRRWRMGEYSRKLAALYDLGEIREELAAIYAGLLGPSDRRQTFVQGEDHQGEEERYDQIIS